MSGKLSGRVAVVTGGASGIGLAIARGFAAEGARVCIADLGAERCAAAATSIRHEAFAVELDLRDLASIEAVVREVAASAGGIDVLVNCAGVFGMQPFVDLTVAEYTRIFDVNVRGTMFMIQAAARQMIGQGRGGTIVNIASGAGRRAAPGAAIYSASKAAVVSLTQCAALELVGHGIRVNAIAPGAVETPMWSQVEREFSRALDVPLGSAKPAQVAATPIARMSSPDEYVGAALFLASDASSFVVGQTFNIDGGMNLG